MVHRVRIVRTLLQAQVACRACADGNIRRALPELNATSKTKGRAIEIVDQTTTRAVARTNIAQCQVRIECHGAAIAIDRPW